MRVPAAFVLRALLLLLLLAPAALGAFEGPPAGAGDDFSLMLFAFALLGLCIVLFLMGAGIVAAVLVSVSAALLVMLGVLSSAALVGLWRRRFSSGLRAFHYQACAIAAVPAGIGAAWLVSLLLNPPLQPREILAVGSIAGLLGGLLLAFGFDRIAVLAGRRIQRLRVEG